ncbi:MAG: SpoVR family protein [Planctomycetes bacterium]|nr:SpoVR family protein [Planctomycetota bacterium]
MSIETEIRKIQIEVEGYAREYGLDFFETIFEVLDFDELNEVAAYGGFPTRYPYWRFGMEYDQLSKGYAYGLQKIYEMVINNDPCYAYLLKCNHLVDQKIVIAHVYGHCDFFKNNYWFSRTDRKMMDHMANHGTRIRQLIEKIGLEKVESFLDACLSLDNLIDFHAPFIRRKPSSTGKKAEGPRPMRKLKAKRYMDRYINPEDYITQERERVAEEIRKTHRFPSEPQKDVLKFLLDHAPLSRWQQEILSIVRDEAYYYAPQMQTKIMNEGWASYWHSTIMTKKVLRDSEIIDFADHHAGTLATSPGRINPYKLGIELFRDIEDRWNKGRFGKDYDDCNDLYEKMYWDKHLDQGRDKIFEVRKIYNDVTFIDTFMNAEFCEAQKLFVYQYNPRTGQNEIVDRDHRKVKEGLLFGLTNFGQPYIYVIDGNFQNRGELLLGHKWTGIELQFDHAQDTLRNVGRVWGRPVHILTVANAKEFMISFDGKEIKAQELERTEDPPKVGAGD